MTLGAEEWAILKGLNLAWDLGLRAIVIESDAKELVDRLNNDRSGNSGNSVCWQIQNLRKKEWDIRIEYIHRANQVADFLAKRGISSTMFLDVCPEFLRSLVLKDKLGFNSPSLIP
ncbi:hypothetical protein QN277_015869 [Acacia crassicarpa]|uniref:RNase H type-1 domain-containing protein n=1 Tax=Acacia crassicarpa TaxID=499986 RepID=A0AAE1JWS3_9FABA|nr:hypothetical protein QN277_015869 [Acacia crassicarpa]